MADESPNQWRTLWQSQPTSPRALSLVEIRERASGFQNKVRRRNLREYAAAVVVFVVFGRYSWEAQTWLGRTGPALIVLGTLFIVHRLFTRAGSRAVPGGDDEIAVAESCVAFHRRELERQRELLRTVWWWYLGPLIPGLLVMLLDDLNQASSRGGAAVLTSLGSALLVLLVFLGVWRWNAAGAKRLERELEALGAR